MKKMKAISAVLTVMVTAPIWLYLLYQVLDKVGATDAMWLLYWVYFPVTLIATTIHMVAISDD